MTKVMKSVTKEDILQKMYGLKIADQRNAIEPFQSRIYVGGKHLRRCQRRDLPGVFRRTGIVDYGNQRPAIASKARWILKFAREEQ